MQDISIGTELAYDYNFEWYGGAKVRCLCGAVSCSGGKVSWFPGRRILIYGKTTMTDIPLRRSHSTYDSAEDEPSSKLRKMMESFETEITSYGTQNDITIKPHESSATEEYAVIDEIKTDVSEDKIPYSQDNTQQSFTQTNAMISRIRSNSTCRNYHIGPGPTPDKRSKPFSNKRSRILNQKQVDVKLVAQLLPSKEAQDEIINYEKMSNYATSELDSLYNEIRPAIEEHERDSQDSVPTMVAEKWIESCCFKLKAEFDLHFSIIKNLAFDDPRKALAQAKPLEGGSSSSENEVKFLTF